MSKKPNKKIEVKEEPKIEEPVVEVEVVKEDPVDVELMANLRYDEISSFVNQFHNTVNLSEQRHKV